MKGADMVVQALLANEVPYVFGVNGDTTLPILDALYDHAHEIHYMTVRHEQVGTAMADGYARVTGRPGVVLNHVGPGACNMVIAMAAAFKDSSPVVGLTGAQDQAKQGRDSWHEIDQVAILRPITKWSTMVRSPAEVGRVVGEGFRRALSGRPGPVHISIPKDVSKAEVPLPLPPGAAPGPKARTWSRVKPLPELIQAAARLLKEAERPVVMAGGGVIRAGASAELVRLAELLGVPVVTSGMGRGAIPEDHPLAAGMSGHQGTATASNALREADLVLAVGCRFSDLATLDWSLIDPARSRIIQIDIDPGEVGRQYPVDLGIVGDAKLSLEDLLACLEGAAPSAPAPQQDWSAVPRLRELVEMREREWQRVLSAPASVPLKPQLFIQALSQVLRRDAIIAVGAGVHSHFASRLRIYEPGSFLKSMGLGAMGFAFPAALGAKLAKPDKQVVAVVGDGDFAMVMQDLETAVREKIGVVVVILNNFSFGANKNFQRTQYAERYIGCDFGNIPFDAYAQLVGARGLRVAHPDEVKPALAEALAADGPALLDVIIDPHEYPPQREEVEQFVLGRQRR